MTVRSVVARLVLILVVPTAAGCAFLLPVFFTAPSEISQSAFESASERTERSASFTTDLQVQSAVTPTLAPRTNLRFPSSMDGVVTEVFLSESGSLSCGKSMMTVDDFHLFLICSERPLWRDLDVGDEGPDVLTAVQIMNELIDAGLDPDLDKVSWPVATAFRKFNETYGNDDSNRRRFLSARQFVFADVSSEPDVSAISIVPGDLATPGFEFASIEQRVEKLELAAAIPLDHAALPDGITWIFDAGGVSIGEVSPDGSISVTADAVETIERMSEDQTSIPGRLKLTEPVKFHVLPLGVVQDLESDTPCIQPEQGSRVFLPQGFILRGGEIVVVESDQFTIPDNEELLRSGTFTC